MTGDLITADEVEALRARAKTITMKEGLHLTMQDGFVPVIPMNLKSGYCVSLTMIDPSTGRDPIEVFSVGACKSQPDPADAEHLAKAVLGEGCVFLGSLLSKSMVHFCRVM